MFKYLIFDLDGTLLYTLEDLSDSINYMLAKYGFETHSIDDVRRFVGNGLRKLVERALPNGANQEGFEEFLVEFIDYYNHHNKQYLKEFYHSLLQQVQSLNKYFYFLFHYMSQICKLMKLDLIYGHIRPCLYIPLS